MARVVGRLTLAAVLLMPSGCAAVAVGVCECVWEGMCDAAFSAITGESDEERSDRHLMESYRQSWATPGRTDYEIETEACGTFRRKHGRDPQ
jgi:hypothetical protein